MREAFFVPLYVGCRVNGPLSSLHSHGTMAKCSCWNKTVKLLCASLLLPSFLIGDFLLCRFFSDFVNVSYLDARNKITDYIFSSFFYIVYVSLLMHYL